MYLTMDKITFGEWLRTTRTDRVYLNQIRAQVWVAQADY
jgi:hypothetical protein